MGGILALALAAAVYPQLLAGVVVILTRPNPRPLLWGCYLGSVVISLAASAAVLAVFDAHDSLLGTSSTSLGPGGYLVIGGLTLLLSGLAPDLRKEYLAPLAERDPEAAARLEARIAQAGRQGHAVSEEELEAGVWAVSAPVLQGKRMIAVITVPSPLVRAPAHLQEKLVGQVQAAARDLNEALRVPRR